MKKVVTVLLLATSVARAGDSIVTFDVRSEAGAPIENVGIELYSRARYTSTFPYGKVKDVVHSTATDEQGRAKISFPCYDGSFYAFVRKEGFYPEETGSISLYRKPDARHESFWVDSATNVSTILRRIINPVPTYQHPACRGDERIPLQKGLVAYDLEVGDWVSPYGKGKVPDFNIYYDRTQTESSVCSTGVLFFAAECAGAYKRLKFNSSSFCTDYNADTNSVYLSSFPFMTVKSSKDGMESRMRILEKDEYLVLRTRVVLDPDNNIIKANYSVIEGPLVFARYFDHGKMRFNPNVNDTSLEYSPDKNLVPFKERR